MEKTSTTLSTSIILIVDEIRKEIIQEVNMNLRLTVVLVSILCLISSPMLFAGESVINGQVYYNGNNVGPVRVALLTLELNLDEILTLETLETGPGIFQFDSLKGGTYFVGAFMDVNEDGLPGLTEPLGAHPKPVVVTEGSVVIDSVDVYLNELPRGNSSIAGQVIYTGDQTGKPHIYALGLTGTPFTYYCPPEGETGYSLDELMPGKYFIVGFLDVNDNSTPDIGEPVGFLQDEITIGNDENLTGINLELFDPERFNGQISGNISYAGTETGSVYIYTVAKSYTPVKTKKLDFPGTMNYTVEHLAPGEYLMFAFLDTNDNETFDPLKLNLKPLPSIAKGEPYELIAEPVIVEDEQAVQQDLILDVDGEGGISGTITYDGEQRGSIVLTAAIGLSPTWLGLAAGQRTNPGQFNYSIPDLDAGYFGVLGIMLTDLNMDFENLKNVLNMPIGFYTKELVNIKPPEMATDIDFILQDSTTSTSTIAGTVRAPSDLSGRIHLFSVGLSLTPYHHEILAEPGDFVFDELRMGRFLVGGFMDVNGNATFDIGEPFDITDSMVEIPHGDMTETVELVLGTDLFTEVAEADQAFKPGEFKLGQNYPNPFNPTTHFRYQIPESRHVEIKVYNMLGHEVKTLVSAKQPAGLYDITWDGTDNLGNEVSSGVYLYSLKAGSFMDFKKMTLLR
ncbi:T9SS type A sorting domain-containing protein [candidate division KSB1 bacterium]|nr:T9SS type A sorting domain-containing protein [candidate division KSB1 bacterium]